MYHDVGKIHAPEYFIENQHGPNPHDRLDPAESARILRAHVFDGVELVTPSPQSRETGIVMIADQLEATARSKPPGDDDACDALVQMTIERILGERQLVHAGITTKDVDVAGRAFRALQAMYQRRLTYPTSGVPPARGTVNVFRSPRRRTVS